MTGFLTDGFLWRSWLDAGAPGSFWSFWSLGSEVLLMLDLLEDGAVAGLSPRRMEARLEEGGGASGRLRGGGAPRLVLEMLTTLLRPCCSEEVRVRTDELDGDVFFFVLVSSGTSLC